MSPACCAPASATAPATRLATTLPGAMPANTTCGAQEAHANNLHTIGCKTQQA